MVAVVPLVSGCPVSVLLCRPLLVQIRLLQGCNFGDASETPSQRRVCTDTTDGLEAAHDAASHACNSAADCANTAPLLNQQPASVFFWRVYPSLPLNTRPRHSLKHQHGATACTSCLATVSANLRSPSHKPGPQSCRHSGHLPVPPAGQDTYRNIYGAYRRNLHRTASSAARSACCCNRLDQTSQPTRQHQFSPI